MTWSMAQAVVLTVGEEDDDTRLDRWLRRRFPGLSQVRIEKALRRGEIRIDGARAKSGARVRAGQAVRLPPFDLSVPKRTDAPQGVSPSDAALIRSLVIYEDERIIAINKPSGLAVQGGSGTRRHVDGMTRALVPEGADKPRLVHRLDRDTSGVLVLAKTLAMANSLARGFRERDLDKVYWAVTIGVPQPPAGEISSWMIKASGPGEDKEKMRLADQTEKGSVHALTRYCVISPAGRRAAWVALKPETGRTHQLRVHMASIGCAILGDRKYTCDRPAPSGLAEGLHLHARALRIPAGRPGAEPIEIIADLPPHMEETFGLLGFDAASVADPFFTLRKIRRR